MIDPDSDSSSGPEPKRLPAHAARDFWADLRRNLATGVRAAFFLPVRREDLRPAPAQLVALVLIGFTLQVLFSVLREGTPGELDYAAVPSVLVYVPLVLLCAWVIAW